MKKRRAYYSNLNSHSSISDGENCGDVKMAAFGFVLINWHGINPSPLPPIPYPTNLWNFEFGGSYFIIGEDDS